MEQDKSIFKIPSRTPPVAYSFVAPEVDDVYEELTAISEEILECRSRNVQN